MFGKTRKGQLNLGFMEFEVGVGGHNFLISAANQYWLASRISLVLKLWADIWILVWYKIKVIRGRGRKFELPNIPSRLNRPNDLFGSNLSSLAQPMWAKFCI